MIINMDEKLYSASTQMTPDIYKDFYKTYYSEKLKVLNIFTSISAVLLIIAAVFLYYKNFGILWSLIALWLGVFLLIYPRRIYRKPYKKSKDSKQTTHFAFYNTYMTEKANSQKKNYTYSDLKKIIETKKYFFIFHSDENVSIVCKENIDGDSDSLASLLKTKTEYKRLKK